MGNSHSAGPVLIDNHETAAHLGRPFAQREVLLNSPVIKRQRSQVKRHSYTAFVFVLLMGTWMVFSGLFDVFHLTLGVISCGIVAWMSADLLFDNRETGIGARFGQTFRLLAYFGWLLWQVVLANLHLIKLAFASKEALQPQIVRYPCRLKSDFEKYLLANSITLTPGTVTMKIMGDVYYIHAISDFAASGLDGEMERRIARIFDPKGVAREGKTNSETESK